MMPVRFSIAVRPGVFPLLLAAACATTSPVETPVPDAGAEGGVVDEPLRSDEPAGATCTGGDARAVNPANGHCYLLFSTATATWQRARELCRLLGPNVDLAKITSAAEDAQLVALAGPDDVWVGGSDLTVEGTWQWTGGDPVTYTHWGPGEPNDGGPVPGMPPPPSEDCMILRKVAGPLPQNVGFWDDRDCNTQYRYICERP
jgi:hypothetical protein